MQTKTWALYLIENRMGQLYCGISVDLTRRFKEHQISGPRCAKALKGKGPLTLRFAATLENQSIALKSEYWMKQQQRRVKNAIIEGKQQIPFDHQIVSANDLIQIQQQS